MGSKIKILSQQAGSGPDGPEKFFASKKFLSSLTLAQLSMQASKVVAAKAARVKTKDKYPWFLLYESPVPTLLILFFFIRSVRGRRALDAGLRAAEGLCGLPAPAAPRAAPARMRARSALM